MDFKVYIFLLCSLWVGRTCSTMITLHKDGATKADKKDDHPFCPYIHALKQNLDNFGPCGKDDDEPEKLPADKRDAEVVHHHHHHHHHCDACGHLPEARCPHCGAPTKYDVQCSHHHHHQEVTTTLHDAVAPCPLCQTTTKEQLYYLPAPGTPCHACNSHRPYAPIIPNVYPYYYYQQHNLGYPGRYTLLHNHLQQAQSVKHIHV